MDTRSSLAIFASGVGIGVLVGLAASPVVQTVVSGVLGLACGATAVLAGIPDREVGQSETHRRRVDPIPVSMLVFGLVFGSLLGITVRTNDLLGRSLEREVARWAKTGLKQEEIYRRLFDHEYLLQKPSENTPVNPGKGVLYSDAIAPPGQCSTLLRSSPEEIRRLFQLSDSRKLQRFAAAAEPAALRAFVNEYLCSEASSK